MSSNPDDLERAVERLTSDLAEGQAGLVVVFSEDLRLILSANREMRAALEPFAKAAALFCTGDYANHDACIYRPAAGDEYSLSSGHLFAARSVLSTKETT
jgi:hypothetical protein